MKKVLIDINIILDFLAQREFHEIAAEIMTQCFRGELAGHIGAFEVTTLSYFLERIYKDDGTVRNILSTVLDTCSIIPTDEKILRDSLLSPIGDYEDAVIESSALQLGLDYIITRNTADFKQSRIPALPPEEFLLLD
ncbi:twitching motility protein PilT [Spirochaetia bacterium]|nr:twitching motility protein PilT [Spirochaetia bacterium]